MTEERDEVLDNSKCKDCEHLISRIIIPIDFEEFGIDINDLKKEIEEEDGEPFNDEEEIAIVHNTCKVLNMDLNHLVVECNKYTPGNSIHSQGFFKSKNPWKLIDKP